MPRHRFSSTSIPALLALIVVLTPPSDALAFDGNRHGFILGFGGGYGGLFAVSQNVPDVSGKGVLTELVVGHGVSEQWLVHYSGRQIWGSSHGILYTGLFPSVAVTHYTLPKSPSTYLTASLGAAAAGDVAFDNGRGSVTGPVVFAGVGYETAKHIGFELGGGVITSGGGVYGVVGLTMKALAY